MMHMNRPTIRAHIVKALANDLVTRRSAVICSEPLLAGRTFVVGSEYFKVTPKQSITLTLRTTGTDRTAILCSVICSIACPTQGGSACPG